MSDADDLLIFKLRGISKAKNPKPREQEQKKEAVQSPKAVEQEVKMPEERVSAKKVEPASVYAQPEEEIKVEPVEIERKEITKGSLYDIGGGAEQSKSYSPKKGLTKEESRKVAQSLKCLVHPWRPAYAVCNYCKMGFCYADIVEHQDGYYCIEDSEKVIKVEPVHTKVRANVILKISATLFLMIFLLLFYFTFQQASFILGHLGNNAFRILPSLPYPYAISLFNLLLALFALFDGIAILLFTSRSIEISEIISGIIILAMSYEYLISSDSYLIGIAIFAVGAMVGVLISKVIENTLTFVQESSNTEINWPRLETFG